MSVEETATSAGVAPGARRMTAPQNEPRQKSGSPIFGLLYDFRNPARWRRPLTGLYRDTLDQIAWVDLTNIGRIWLCEHHFSEDPHTSAPLVLAAAVGERTSTVRIGTSVIVAPLHDPVRLAEDAATLSVLTGGRFDLGLGQGYCEHEFDGFGRRMSHRPSLLEESVALIRRAWSGARDPFEGRRFRFPDLPITPVPEQSPQILVGARRDRAIERAARIADGFISTAEQHSTHYLDALERIGKSRNDGRIYAYTWAIVAEDPERTWSEIGQHALFQMNELISWGAFGPVESNPPFTSPDHLLAHGPYRLWDAEMAINELTALLTRIPQVSELIFPARLPGERLETSSARIEYLGNRVVPAVHAQPNRKKGLSP